MFGMPRFSRIAFPPMASVTYNHAFSAVTVVTARHGFPFPSFFPLARQRMIELLKWTLSLVGHVGLWCLLFNWLHATTFSRPGRKLSEKGVLLGVFGPMVWVLIQWVRLGTVEFDKIREVSQIAYAYGWFCLLVGVGFSVGWAVRKLTRREADAVLDASTEWIDVAATTDRALLQGTYATLLGWIPGNQATKLTLERKTFQLGSLPPALDGLKIAQLSDLHFTGQLDIAFFEEVVRHANRFEPDLVILTGDVVDAAKCVPWIVDVLSPLEARLGKYSVLGNHDLRIKDEALIRNRLGQAGFVGLEDQWEEVVVEGVRMGIAGNEIPWFLGADRLPKKRGDDRYDFQLLLSHSPDQFPWALDYGFDLMFAGHTHGGQIRFPLIGPVIAPSRYGVKYSAGTFAMGRMLMHVSRGLSGDDLVRIDCPPELGLFTLRRG